jgi:hypothetical protein
MRYDTCIDWRRLSAANRLRRGVRGKVWKTPRRPGAAVAAILLLLGSFVSAARADLSFDPLNGNIVDTLVVSVTVDGSIADLRGFTWTLEFDPSIVMPVAVAAGSLVTNAGCPNFVTWLNFAAIGDSISVDGATLGCSVNGPGAIVDITFVGVGFGVSPLNWRRSELRNSLNASIPHTCTDGTITRMTVAVEDIAWGRFKRWYR